METRNARISKTYLGFEDHDIYSCAIILDFGDFTLGFGAYDLDYHTDMIKRVLRVVGVQYWEELKGKLVRALIDGHKIIGIGHIIEDKWYSPKEK